MLIFLIFTRPKGLKFVKFMNSVYFKNFLLAEREIYS